ncbi:MAG: MG2 domain-containing protein [Capsulimonadaceae bacterium]
MRALSPPLIRVAAILAAATACLAVWYTQPGTGTAIGTCLDSKTLKPIVRAHVTLDRQTPDDDTDSGDDIQNDVDGTPGSLAAPFGWSQSSAGDDITPTHRADTEYTALCDASGRFVIPHVPAGTYSVSAEGLGYESNDGDTITITTGRVTHDRLTLDSSGSSLEFSQSVEYWLPSTDDPVVGLHGRLSTPRVSMTVDRVDLNGLFARAPYSLANSTGGEDFLPSLDWPGALTPVKSWQAALSHQERDGSFYERIHIGALPAGVYRVLATCPDTEATAWLVVTRLALVRKAYGSHVLAYVCRMADGVPAANVTVRAYQNDTLNVLSRAVTGHDGVAHLTTTGAPEEASGAVIARDGDSIAAVRVELNSPGSSDGGDDNDSSGQSPYSPGALRSFLYTERPIYRPGDTVCYKGVARWFRPPAVDGGNDLAIVANQAVSVDIKDAQQNLVSHQDLRTDSLGSWNGLLALSPDALTGAYTIDATLGGRTVEGDFVVAAYRKPEFQVKIAFDKKRYVRGDTIRATVTAVYYFGAPLTGATLEYTANNGDEGEDDESGPYHLPTGDESSTNTSNSGEPLTQGTIRLDDNGQAVIDIPTHGGQADEEDYGDSTITVDANVTDVSKRNVDEQASVDVGQGEFSLLLSATPYAATPGGPISILAHATDADGNAKPNQAIEIVTCYEAWNGDELHQSDIRTHSLTTGTDGTVSLTVVAPRAGLFTVTAKAVDRRGNHIEDESTVWVASVDSDVEAQYPDMSILLDRPKYGIGDTAHVLINTQHPGPSALVTVEGATLYQSWTVPLRRRSTALDIPVSAAYSPGVTISVCAIDNKQYLSSEAHLAIDDVRRVLTLAVTAADITRPPNSGYFAPGDTASVSVRAVDPAGRPVRAEISVGVVDSAIYAIKEDSDVDLADFMQPDQGNAVDTDYSCPPLYLGDVDKGSIDVKLRSNFRDTAYWAPDVMTGPDGRATVRFALPDNLTTWRVTCIGQTADTRIGKATSTFTVNKDLDARLEVPAFLVSGDRSTLDGVVDNNTSRSVDAVVRLTAAGLNTSGDVSRSVTVPARGSVDLSWPVDAPASIVPSTADLRLTAAVTGGPSDGVEQALPINPHTAAAHVWHSGNLVHYAESTLAFDHGADARAGTLHISLSSTEAAALLPAAQYLEQYPYGTTDSSAAVLIGDAVLGQTLPTLRSALFPAQPRLADMTRRSILRVARFQTPDGGWGWCENDKQDMWMTADALFALELAEPGPKAEGKETGREEPAVNPAVMAAGFKALSGMVRTERFTDYEAPCPTALAALVLARGGHPADARVKLLALQRGWATFPDRVYTADLAAAALAAHAIGGDMEPLADQYMGRLGTAAYRMGTLTAWPFRPHQPADGASQEPPDADSTSWAMLAAESITPADPRIPSAARWMMGARTGDYWYCPRSTALALLALNNYLAEAHELQPNFVATVSVNGRTVRRARFGPESIDRPDITVDVPGSEIGSAAAIHLAKEGQGRLYYTLDLRESLPVGAPTPPMPVWERWYDRLAHPERLTEPFAPTGYRIKRVFLRDTSRRNFFWEDTVPTSDQSFRRADDVIVRLIIDAVRPGSHIIVEEPVPAGCTISEVSGDETDDWTNWWDYTDVRDDRVVFFIGDLTRGRHEIDYHLRAAAPGTYDVMPTALSSAFDTSLHALGPANRISISP